MKKIVNIKRWTKDGTGDFKEQELYDAFFEDLSWQIQVSDYVSELESKCDYNYFDAHYNIIRHGIGAIQYTQKFDNEKQEFLPFVDDCFDDPDYLSHIVNIDKYVKKGIDVLKKHEKEYEHKTAKAQEKKYDRLQDRKGYLTEENEPQKNLLGDVEYYLAECGDKLSEITSKEFKEEVNDFLQVLEECINYNEKFLGERDWSDFSDEEKEDADIRYC